MRVESLPDNSRGVDCNRPISAAAAAAFVAKNYSFAIRYVRRQQAHDYDLSVRERDDILNAGLGLMIVQHVAPDGWIPSGPLGTAYGGTAVDALGTLGIPANVSVWLDLEGVKDGTLHQSVIDFCNNWFDVVDAIGYTPGLYVGFGAGLTPDELYHKLKFQSYWSAYNLDADKVPSVRGVQMRQAVAKPADLIPGFTNQNMDCDTIRADALGGTPTLLFASLPSPE